MSEQIQIPVGLHSGANDMFVVLLKGEKAHFKEPFFIDSIAKSFTYIKESIKLPEQREPLARPIHYKRHDRRVVYTPIKQFITDWEGELNPKNCGFLFHMSRCGSTLATQMLAGNKRFFVLSEPTIINAVLDPAIKIAHTERCRLFKASILSLIACAPDICEHVFIKFRSWNVLYLNLILKQFSDIRWVFIHRHGLEVLASVLEKPPGWLRSRMNYTKYFAKFLTVERGAIRMMSESEYAARMLGAFCRIVKGKSKAVCIDYTNLKKALPRILTDLWALDLTQREKHSMAAISRIYSKDRKRKIRFVPDAEIKRKKGTKAQRRAIDEFVERERLSLRNFEP